MKPIWIQIVMSTLLQLSGITATQRMPSEPFQQTIPEQEPVYYYSRMVPNVQNTKWQRLDNYGLSSDGNLQSAYHGNKVMLRAVDPPHNKAPAAGVFNLGQNGGYYEYNLYNPERELIGSRPEYEFVAVPYGQDLSAEVPLFVSNLRVLRPEDLTRTVADVRRRTPLIPELGPSRYYTEVSSPYLVHEIPRNIGPTPSSLHLDGRYDPIPLPTMSNLPSSAVIESSAISRSIYENADRVINDNGASKWIPRDGNERPSILKEDFESVEFLGLPRKLQDDIRLIDEFVHGPSPTENDKNH